MLCTLESSVVQMELSPRRTARELVVSTMGRCVYLSLEGSSKDDGSASRDRNSSTDNTDGKRDSSHVGAETQSVTAVSDMVNEVAAATLSPAALADSKTAPKSPQPKQIGKKNRNGAGSLLLPHRSCHA